MHRADREKVIKGLEVCFCPRCGAKMDEEMVENETD